MGPLRCQDALATEEIEEGGEAVDHRTQVVSVRDDLARVQLEEDLADVLIAPRPDIAVEITPLQLEDLVGDPPAASPFRRSFEAFDQLRSHRLVGVFVVGSEWRCHRRHATEQRGGCPARLSGAAETNVGSRCRPRWAP
jgi:hypothetical protein